MEKKQIGILGAVIAVVAVVALLGVTYAAFTQQLSVDGTATVNKSSWKIRFVDLKSVEKTGTATEVTQPSIQSGDTTISNFAVTLKTPGDSVSYKFSVTNEGTFNATLSSINVQTPSCTGSGAHSEDDQTNVCSHLEYTLTYAEGGAINPGDLLNAGDTKELLLKLVYKDNITAEELPQDDVTIGNLAATLVYKQAA